jgi:molybdopterin synthase catalytic subunit/molybdopterin converting factor small subunit
VKVNVRLFALYREAVGASRVEVTLEGESRGQAVWTALVSRYPKLAHLPAPSGYAVNDEYVDGGRLLHDDDEVALIPPVSGGEDDERQSRPPLIEITDGPIAMDRLVREVADPYAGAVVLFLGIVRDNARGRRVRRLEYEAYEALARREMEKIAAAITSRWPVIRVGIIHRTGPLAVGETSVAISVSAPHRAEAFEAARFGIDTLKLTVPIWKKEIWEGGEAWVGAEA